MEYIFTNLPQYIRITPRSDFSSSVVSSGAVLLFTEDGLTLTGKLPDGTFITIGGSSGPDPVGDATSGDILAGKSATVSGGSVISGTIQTVSATSAGSQINVPAGYIPTSQTFNVSGGGVDVSSTTAEAADVLSGKVFYDSAGVLTSGGIQTVSAYAYDNICVVPSGYISSQQEIEVGSAILATEITPSVSSQIINAGGYLLGDVIIKGDSNLVASNIVSGVSIFGVPGEVVISSGAEVTLGVVDAQGKFQAFSFTGTIPTDSGTPETVTNYKTWNSTLPAPTPTPVLSGYTYDFRNFQSGNSWSSNGYTMTSSNSLSATNGILNIPYGESVLGSALSSTDYMLSVIIKLNIGGGSTRGMLVGCADGGLGPYTDYWIYSSGGSDRPVLAANIAGATWHRIDVICCLGQYFYRYNKNFVSSNTSDYWSTTAPAGLFMRCISDYYSSIDIAFFGYLDHIPSSAELQILDNSVDDIFNQLS